MDTNSHAFKRYKERFGKELNIYGYQNIINKIRNKQYMVIPYEEPRGNERIAIAVLYNDKVLRLVYNTKTNTIVTFLPEAPVDKLYKGPLKLKEE